MARSGRAPRIPILAKVLIILALIYVGVKWGLPLVGPPLPSSLIAVYMTLTAAALLFYVTLSNRRIADFLHPLATAFDGGVARMLGFGVLIALPLATGNWARNRFSTSIEPPPELRVVHPASPEQIVFREEPVRITGLENPLREDEEHWDENLAEGAQIYFSNCVFCHGPRLDGKGPLADGLNPPPADFTDIGTIAQLQESYLFWRISKGGPGLPRQAHSWNSAMPEWEKYLEVDQIWKVILFLYEGAGVSPRTWD